MKVDEGIQRGRRRMGTVGYNSELTARGVAAMGRLKGVGMG